MKGTVLCTMKNEAVQADVGRYIDVLRAQSPVSIDEALMNTVSVE